jgi:hypothetical protein
MSGVRREGGLMSMTDVDARISRLLDQLEKGDLNDSEITRIKLKIKLLRDLEAESS